MASYEELRLSNIKRNNSMLQSLGIEAVKPVVSSASSSRRSRKTKFSKDFTPIPGERASKRIRDAAMAEKPSLSLKSICASYVTAPDNVSRAYHSLSDDVADYFRNEKDEHDLPGRKPSALWDLSKKHQHLQASSSRRTVATTGCAGYGAVLASGSGSGVATVVKGALCKDSDGQSWRVRVLRRGVGGFAIGVATINASKPFKSLSNRPDSWVVNSSGMFCHDRKEVSVTGRPDGGCLFDDGDLLRLDVSVTGVLSLSVNQNTKVRVSVLPPGKYVLCCQPYMGGVARLV
jgi:hypothetical protein